MADLYFEDFAVGDSFVTDSESVTEAQIIRFAKEWDPQPFHTDIEAAARHELGGLFASGMHTLGISFRLFIATEVLAACNIVGAGLDKLRWPRPVRPGDVLTAVTKPGKSWEKESKRAGKLMFSERVTEYRDQNGELVCTARGVGVKTERPVDQG